VKQFSPLNIETCRLAILFGMVFDVFGTETNFESQRKLEKFGRSVCAVFVSPTSMCGCVSES